MIQDAKDRSLEIAKKLREFILDHPHTMGRHMGVHMVEGVDVKRDGHGANFILEVTLPNTGEVIRRRVIITEV